MKNGSIVMVNEPKVFYVNDQRCECNSCTANYAKQSEITVPKFDPENTSTIELKRALGLSETDSLLYLNGKPIMYEYETLELLFEQFFLPLKTIWEDANVELEIKERTD